MLIIDLSRQKSTKQKLGNAENFHSREILCEAVFRKENKILPSKKHSKNQRLLYSTHTKVNIRNEWMLYQIKAHELRFTFVYILSNIYEHFNRK